MKTLIIAFRSIYDFIIRQKSVFLIILVSLAVSAAAGIYFYGLFIKNAVLEQKSKSSFRQFIIQFNPDDKISDKNDLVKEIIDLNSSLNIVEIQLSTAVLIEETHVNICGINEINRDLKIINAGGFTADDIKQHSEYAILSEPINGITIFNEQDTEFNIFNDTYKVKSLERSFVAPHTIYLPYSTYLEKGYEISEFKFVLKKQPDSMQISIIKEKTDSYPYSVKLIPPIEYSSEMVLGMLVAIGFITAIFIFCMLNVANLFRFWIYENKYKLMIYKLCGANRASIRSLILLEIALIGVVGFCGGYILYTLLTPYLKRIDFFYDLKIRQFALIVLLYFLTIYLSVFRTSHKISKAAPVDKALWG